MKLVKKTILSLGFVGLVVATQGQANNRTSAIMAYKDFTSAIQKQDMEGAKKHLMTAKEFIDKAATHPDTEKDAKTLYYKGDIYLSLSGLGAMDESMKEYATEETFRTGLDAYKASMENKNKKNDFTNEITMKMSMARARAFNMGVEMFNKKQFKDAKESFEGCMELMSVIGQVDTMSAFNAGLMALNMKDYPSAIKYYTICADNGYNGPSMYSTLANVYGDQMDANNIKIDSLSKLEGDAGKAEIESLKAKNIELSNEASAILKKGRDKYPTDNEIVMSEVSLHLRSGNNEAAEKALQVAVERNPKDPLLYFAAGVVYDNLKRYDEAAAQYKKAIELKSDYFDAYFNLGAMYHNEAADIYNKINDIKDNAVYEKERQRADARFKEALPYLEKARELSPKDRDNLIMLKNVYGRLNMNDKWKEVNDALKNG